MNSLLLEITSGLRGQSKISRLVLPALFACEILGAGCVMQLLSSYACSWSACPLSQVDLETFSTLL